MPQPFNSAVLTDSGAALLTKAQAGECKITFTRMAIGNGSYTDEEKTVSALQSMEGLRAEQNSYTPSNISVYSEYSVIVTALITNQDPSSLEALVTEGYYINEIGLFAKETDGDDDTEILYSIAVTSGDNGDFMPPYNGYCAVQITQDYYVTVNNSAEVTVSVEGAAALKEDMEARLAELASAMLSVSYDEENETIVLKSGTFSGYSGSSSASDVVMATDSEVEEAIEETFGS